MNFEVAKNIILTFLVVASVILTWNIWTYQPDLKKSESDYVESDVQELANVIKPGQVLFHHEGQHFQTQDKSEIKRIQDELFTWDFYNFKDASHLAKEFTSFIHANGNAEMIFPSTVPLDLYKSELKIDDQELPKVYFDRIVFNTENMGSNETEVYFINYKNKKIFQAQVQTAQINNFTQNFASGAHEYPEYISKEVSSSRTLFLPKNSVQLNPLTYYIDYLDINKDFKNELFNDPDKVKRENVSVGNEYTDGSSLLTVFKDSSVVEFVNPGQRSDMDGTTGSLIRNSLNFINSQPGWDDYYQYADISEAERMVSFRLYIDDIDGIGRYPVFNGQGMSEIKHEWGNEEIYRYERPYFTLISPPFPNNQNKVTLLSGQQVIERLTRNFELADVEEVRVGYKLSKDPTEPVIHLEPAWYYRYGGTWTVVPLNEPGGEKSGLE
ncbi:two-component system activity regulator YycH [Bacillus sp. CECT 9360]|uniref:YycH family regulatory protein n=1 Tax=Bacillus sp. CECT 9360 TaxID=2845821 RepID=UPI001E38137E|nr:two-component system activity regulator YycH [Bacillus sp. CECT 9360]CAH0344912.1 Two-component system WalR/WalK regulatory protein YycH [Bacillus sp. CECT 9360]